MSIEGLCCLSACLPPCLPACQLSLDQLPTPPTWQQDGDAKKRAACHDEHAEACKDAAT